MFQLVRMLGHEQQQEEITLLSVKQQCKITQLVVVIPI